jgi:hypothetical protein
MLPVSFFTQELQTTFTDSPIMLLFVQSKPFNTFSTILFFHHLGCLAITYNIATPHLSLVT